MRTRSRSPYPRGHRLHRDCSESSDQSVELLSAPLAVGKVGLQPSRHRSAYGDVLCAALERSARSGAPCVGRVSRREQSRMTRSSRSGPRLSPDSIHAIGPFAVGGDRFLPRSRSKHRGWHPSRRNLGPSTRTHDVSLLVVDRQPRPKYDPRTVVGDVDLGTVAIHQRADLDRAVLA
jgi:hypothetical protein